jgi:hypothetical protein
MPSFTFILMPGAGGSAWYWHLVVPILEQHRFFPAEFQKRVARERLGSSADEMPGGHLVALSQPEELVARLLAYASHDTHQR